MAKVTLSLNDLSRSASIDDALLPYFFACYREVYGQVEDVDTKILRDMTDEETFQKYAAGISNGTLANVQNFVRNQVVQQAMTKVPEISITPN